MRMRVCLYQVNYVCTASMIYHGNQFHFLTMYNPSHRHTHSCQFCSCSEHSLQYSCEFYDDIHLHLDEKIGNSYGRTMSNIIILLIKCYQHFLYRCTQKSLTLITTDNTIMDLTSTTTIHLFFIWIQNNLCSSWLINPHFGGTNYKFYCIVPWWSHTSKALTVQYTWNSTDHSAL